jgi:hypothetical protein
MQCKILFAIGTISYYASEKINFLISCIIFVAQNLCCTQENAHVLTVEFMGFMKIVEQGLFP